MLQVADAPKFDTVQWDAENDMPLKHCLDELPVRCKEDPSTDSRKFASAGSTSAVRPQRTSDTLHQTPGNPAAPDSLKHHQLTENDPQLNVDSSQLASVEEAAVVAAAKQMEEALQEKGVSTQEKDVNTGMKEPAVHLESAFKISCHQ